MPAGSSFRQRTPQAVMGVRGTKWLTDALSGLTKVTVLDGTVGVSPVGENGKEEKEVAVVKGNTATLIKKAVSVDPLETDWAKLDPFMLGAYLDCREDLDEAIRKGLENYIEENNIQLDTIKQIPKAKNSPVYERSTSPTSNGSSSNSGGNSEGGPGSGITYSPDSRFETGYPSAVVSDNLLNIKIKLKEDTAFPATVYMVVTNHESEEKPDVQAVIHGHGGENESRDEVTEYPLMNISDSTEYNVECSSYIDEKDDCDVYFVIADQKGNVSTQATRLSVSKGIPNDNSPAPSSNAIWCQGANMSQAGDKVYLIFGEALNTSSLPLTTDFSVSDDGTDYIPTTVEVKNVSTSSYPGRLVLQLPSSITTGSTVEIKYTPSASNPVRAQDDATSILGMTIEEAGWGYEISEAYASTDYKDYYVVLTPNYDQDSSEDKFDYDNVKLLYKGDILSLKEFSTGIYGAGLSSYFGTRFSVDDDVATMIAENPALLQLNVVVDNVKTYTEETCTINETIESFEEVGDLVPSSAIYDGENLSIQFDENVKLVTYALYGCSFTLKINGKDYVVRGTCYQEGNQFVLKNENIPFTIQSGDQITLTYTEPDEEYEGIRDILRRQCSDFSINVTVK